MCVVPVPLAPTLSENTILSTEGCVKDTSYDKELTLPADAMYVENAPIHVLFAKRAAVIVLAFTEESTVIAPLKIIKEPGTEGESVLDQTCTPSVT